MFDAAQLFEWTHCKARRQLAFRRGGLRTITLSVELDPLRLARALRGSEPRVVS